MTKDFDFASEFYQKVKDLNIDWNIKGLIASDKRVYAIGDDSKLLGRVFEILAAPIIKEIAHEHDLIVEIPEKQNTYPDFTLRPASSREGDKDKIAIDVKTTYREGNKKLKFTLGSFTSYLRNNTKNIHHSYDQYQDHIIVGFIYTRNLEAEEGFITDLDHLESLDEPYLNVDFFVRNKIDITGEKKGSGNTDNIGSIAVNSVDDFKNKKGPFANLSEELYLHYWQNYPKYTQADKQYTNLDSYFSWLENEKDNIKDAEKLLDQKVSFEEWKK